MWRKGDLYFCSLLCAFVVALSACRFSSSVDTPPSYLVVGIESNPLHLDPRYATDANSARIGGLIYNSLLRADEKSQLQPELAETWRMVDARTFIFHLRRNVHFHNGRPLTAQDVKYTYESILEPSNRSPKRGPLKPLHSVDLLGPYQVRFRLAAPHAPFTEQFTLGIVPSESRGDILSGSHPPLGSGPFILDSIESGEQVTLRANPSYWEGKPNVSGIVFRIVPDAIVRVLEFKKGKIDFLQNDIEPDMLPWLEKNTHAAIATHQGTTFQYIGMNLTHPILSNRKVRQAIALAINRQAIIRHLLKDLAIPASGVLSPLNWAYEPAVHHWTHNLEQAKKLLDEAGYKDPDGEGPEPRFKLSFKTTNLDLRRRIAEAFKQQLQQVGIELEIRTYEWGTFYSDIKKGNFHLYSLAWVGILDPDIFHQIFHSASIPPDGNNRGRYTNALVDSLLEEGRVTADKDERRLIYSKVQKVLAEELPYIPLWWVKNVVVRQPAVQGFVPYPDGDLISLKNIRISSGRPSP